jgi:hypothetical protein
VYAKDAGTEDSGLIFWGKVPCAFPPVTAISEAARELNELRERWLNPSADSIGESELKKRTLTNLYNARPTWLDIAHRKLETPPAGKCRTEGQGLRTESLGVGGQGVRWKRGGSR